MNSSRRRQASSRKAPPHQAKPSAYRAFACGIPGLTIVPITAAATPTTHRRITTGDLQFDSNVYVEARDQVAHGLLDHHTRQLLLRLVGDEQIVLVNRALRRLSGAPSPTLRRDFEQLAPRFSKTSEELADALRKIASEDPNDSVRRHYSNIVSEMFFESDFSDDDEAQLAAKLAGTMDLGPLTKCVRNPSAPLHARLMAMERLMSHFPKEDWLDTLENHLTWDKSAAGLLPSYLTNLQRDETISGTALADFFEFAFNVGPNLINAEVGIAFCHLVQRAIDATAGTGQADPKPRDSVLAELSLV